MDVAKRFVWALAIVALVGGAAFADDEEPSTAAESSSDYRITGIEGIGGAPAGIRRRAHRAGESAGAVEGHIKIRFSRATDLSQVRQSVVVLPVASLDWNRASQDEDQLIRVPGVFQLGVNYSLVVTRPLQDRENRDTIQPGRHPFKVEQEKSQIRFIGGGSVLEREGRQIVHLALRGVEKIKLEAVEVPIHALVPLRQPEPPKEEKRKSRRHGVTKPVTVMSGLPAEGLLDTVAGEWNGRSTELAQALSGHKGAFASLFEGSVKIESDVFFEPGPEGKERRCSLPLAWRPSAKLGRTFLVLARGLEAKDAKEEPRSSIQTLQITDLGLSYKVSKTDLIVWATKLASGEVVSNARVFLATRDGKLLAAGKTDPDGLLKLAGGVAMESLDLATRGAPVGRTSLDPREVWRVIALSESDAAWVNTDECAIKVPKKVKSGEASLAERTRAHAFTERGIYRPRDTVRFKVTVRQFGDGGARAPDVGGPNGACQVVIKDSKGQTVHEAPLTLSAFGTAHGTLTVRTHDPLGQWNLTVKDREGEVEWGETSFAVEEFVPPRHKVDVSFKEKEASKSPNPGPVAHRSAIGKIAATYYAGGPVKNGKVRWKLSLAGANHAIADPKGYVSGTDLPGEPELIESGEAMLGGDGTLSVEIPLSPEVVDGRRSLSLAATVLDFDARVASGTGGFTVEPGYLVGICDHSPTAEAEEPLDLTAVVIDRASGKRVPEGELEVEVLQERWTSIQKRNEDGDFFWSWESVMSRSYQTKAALKDGVAPIQLSFGDGGKYQVRVGYKGTDGTVYCSTTTFNVEWADSDGEGSASKWRAERMRTLSLGADRLEYVPGETAKLRIHLPRPATSYLVSVEREKVLSLRRVVPKSPSDPIEIAIPEDWIPNVYLSVLAVHGRQGYPVYASEADTGAPGYSHGYLTIPVRRVHPGLKVTLTGAGESVSTEPGNRHKIGVTVTDKDGKPLEAEVALAVVDESVLALTGYATPTLEALFRVLLPLVVRTGDLRSVLALQTPFRALTVLPLTGGDGGGGHQSKTREWFDPVAFFQPDLRTDAQGQATVEFTVPDSMTTYRVYALACDPGERHGSTDRPLLSRKPFYLEAGLPRFFTHEDEGKFTVALFNGTGVEGEAKLEVEATGGLTLSVPQATVKIAANDRAQIPVEVRAVSPTEARVKLTARLGDRSDSVALKVPVRSRYVMRTQGIDGITTRTKEKVKLPLAPEIAKLPPELMKLASARVELSTLPALRLVGGLKHLLHYPYGCLEQTSSTVLPLAALRDLIGRGLVPQITLEEADKYLGPGIDRILSMQTSGGGFGYWPGYTSPNPWGSAYAVLALTIARKAGAPVPENEFKRALDYLVNVASGKETGSNHVRAVAFWILSQNKRLTGSPLDLLKIGTGLNREDALFAMLAAAAAGKVREATAKLGEMIPDEPEEESKPATLFDAETFWVPGRTKAVELVALLEISPHHRRVAGLAAELFRAMGPEGHWETTQMSAWSLMALGRFVSKSPFLDRPMSVTAKAAGLTIPGALEIQARGTRSVDLEVAPFFAAPTVDLSREGTAPLVFHVEASYPWRGADVSEDAAPVRRSYHRLAGDGPVKVGDLVEVEIELKMDEAHHFVALVDPLPAGLVAVNSALKTEEQLPVKSGEMDSWTVEDGWVCPFVPSRLENRDDRVVAFRDYNWRGRYRFSYVARAVCEGRFVVPPAKLEPMYRPRTSVLSGSTTFVVEPASK